MKLLQFSARGVHKHYTFNIEFNRDINFLVGVNGSGKTTALKLLQAGLSFNLRDLLLITFSNFDIVFETKSIISNPKINTISIAKDTERLQLLVNREHHISIPTFAKDEMEQYLNSGKFDDYIEERRFRVLRENPHILEFFERIKKPLFLGLERSAVTKADDLMDSDEVFLRNNARHRAAATRGRGIDVPQDGLEHSKALLKTAYRKYRSSSDKQTASLLSLIVKSTFEYIQVDEEVLSPSGTKYEEILHRREEIQKVATELGGENKTSGQIENFFEQLESAYKTMKQSGPKATDLSIEWLLNKAQIQRISKILSEVDVQKRRADSLYIPIRRFEDAANFFFGESRKKVRVDSVGSLNVSINSDDIPLSTLSSGERQLLILLAHVVFTNSQGTDIIIIDEPELSLHLRWQEYLVDKLIELDDTKQFIFATHSPEIVGYRKEKTIKVHK